MYIIVKYLIVKYIIVEYLIVKSISADTGSMLVHIHVYQWQTPKLQNFVYLLFVIIS